MAMLIFKKANKKANKKADLNVLYIGYVDHFHQRSLLGKQPQIDIRVAPKILIF